MFLLSHIILEEDIEVTKLRKRLNNVLTELAIIREGLNTSGKYPSCCLTIRDDGKIGCDITGPLPEEKFLRECEKCRAGIKRVLARFNLDESES